MIHINIEDVAQHEGRFRSRKLIIPVFVPHMGCPHNCCFCNQRKISGQAAPPTYASVIATIKDYKDIVRNYGSVEIAFYGGSFTAIPKAEQEMLLNAAIEGCKMIDFRPEFRLSTRPDCIDVEILSHLKKFGVKTIELGAQSMCDDVLKLSNRGHLSSDTTKASALIKEHGFVLGIQTMPGLPGADRDSEIETARKVISLKPDIVRIYPTIVIRGTELERMFLAGEYKPLDLEEAVDISAILTDMYEKAGIKVIRTGLQSSDNISSDGEVVAGPYHPAFGELVKSGMALMLIRNNIQKCVKEGSLRDTFYGHIVEMSYNDGAVEIVVPAKMLSWFIGQKKRNIIELKKLPFVNNVIIRSE